MRSFRSVIALAACAISFVFSAHSVNAATCPAGDTVTKAANAFIDAAHSGQVAQFADALKEHTDVDKLAIFALGKYRSKLPADRRSEYVANAHLYISAFLASHADGFSGGDIAIESCKGNLVETSLDGKSHMVWKVEGNRISDVKVSGVWLALQLRQKFTDLISKNHGYVTSFIDYLARETARSA